MSVASQYRDDVLEDIGHPVITPSGQQTGVAAGADSQPFALIPRKPGMYVEAVLITAVTTITASATMTSVSGALASDTSIDWVKIAPQANTSARSYTGGVFPSIGTREVERLCFKIDDSSTFSDTAAVASIATGATVSITSVALLPVGGLGGSLTIHAPAATRAFGGGVPTSMLTAYTVRAISGYNPTVVTFRQDTTASLASGASVDVTQWIQDPALAMQWLEFVNTPPSTTVGIQGITINDADGAYLIDVNGTAADNVQTLIDMEKLLGKSNASTASLTINTARAGAYKGSLNLSTAGALDVLRIEFAEGISATPQNPPAQTSQAPASQQQGRAAPGGVTVVAGNVPNAVSAPGRMAVTKRSF